MTRLPSVVDTLLVASLLVACGSTTPSGHASGDAAAAGTTSPGGDDSSVTWDAAAPPEGTSASDGGTARPPEGGSAPVTCGMTSPAPGTCSVTAALEPVPALPTNGSNPGNACKNASLPAAYGTNFPISDDPAGWGPNVTAMGWEGNWWPTFEYASGAFFARGVSTTYKIAYGTLPDHAPSAGTTVCGAMYSFGVATAGGNPAPGSIQWTMADGYLPAFITSFTRNQLAISITNFENRVSIGGHAFGLVYSRVSVTNNGTSPATVDPAPSAGLVGLTHNATTVAPNQSASHDYVVAVDDFGSGQTLPTGSALSSGAPTYDQAYTQMRAYWQDRLSSIPTFVLPDVAIPDASLTNPGTQLENAFRANFIYTRIVQVGKAPFSGANNYAWLLNHDVPGMLANRFSLGDFQDAQNLLLSGRASEVIAGTFPGYGANYYLDGWWKTPWPWAIYLAKTGDTAFVKRYFDDTGSGYGDSLRSLVHQIPAHTAAGGYLAASNDNDTQGTWLFDDYSAIVGLAAYKYVATRIGNASEATWADGQLAALVSATNGGLKTNQQSNHFGYLPCEIDVPMSGDRCGNAGADANWASAAFYGQNAWDSFLLGANLTGIVGDPSQTDALYDYGYRTLLAGSPPFPSAGGYPGYSTADNTGYAQGSLFGTKYRALGLTSYAWQIATTTGGPYAWWEANKVGPSASNPWAGSHAPPQFGACPYAWPLAGQSLALLDSIAAESLSATPSGGSFAYQRSLTIGRGIPDAWLAPGQVISASNLTSAFDMASCQRSTYAVTIRVAMSTPRAITVELCGALPGPVSIQLPIFGSVGVSAVTSGGSYDSSTKTVTVTPGATAVVIQLAT